jgi:hypothetical protein
MDSESDRIFDRMRLHRLMEKHPDWSNKRFADETGKSDGWVRKWKSRLANPTENTFKKYLSKSRAPQTIWCKTPDEVFSGLPSLPKVPEMVQPNAWLDDYHGRVFRRRISSNGTIQVDRQTYYVDTKHHKQRVLVHLDAENEVFFISCDDEVIKRVDIKELLPHEMDFQSYLFAMKQEARTIDLHRLKTWYKIGDIA